MPRCIASVFVEPSRPFVVACCCCRHETSAFHRVRSAARGQRSDLVCTVCVGSLDVHTIQAAALGVRFRGFVFIEAGYRVCFFSFHRSVRVLFYFAIFGLYDKRQAVARSDNCHNTTVGIITTTTTQSKQSSARVVKKRRKERRFPQKVLLPPLSLSLLPGFPSCYSVCFQASRVVWSVLISRTPVCLFLVLVFVCHGVYGPGFLGAALSILLGIH